MRLEEEELREQPVSSSRVRGTRCGECLRRLACDFSLSRFAQYFLLDDFARRTILKTALNRALHRSCDVFERSKRVFFRFASDFFALGADLQRKRTVDSTSRCSEPSLPAYRNA